MLWVWTRLKFVVWERVEYLTHKQQICVIMWHYHMPLQISSMKSNNNFRFVALHEGNKEEILLFLTN